MGRLDCIDLWHCWIENVYEAFMFSNFELLCSNTCIWGIVVYCKLIVFSDIQLNVAPCNETNRPYIQYINESGQTVTEIATSLVHGVMQLQGSNSCFSWTGKFEICVCIYRQQTIFSCTTEAICTEHHRFLKINDRWITQNKEIKNLHH